MNKLYTILPFMILTAICSTPSLQACPENFDPDFRSNIIHRKHSTNTPPQSAYKKIESEEIESVWMRLFNYCVENKLPFNINEFAKRFEKAQKGNAGNLMNLTSALNLPADMYYELYNEMSLKSSSTHSTGETLARFIAEDFTLELGRLKKPQLFCNTDK
jgi:hypothetical protein